MIQSSEYMPTAQVSGDEGDADTLTKKFLPAWAYQKDVAEYMSWEVGPAVPWLRKSALLMLATQIGIFTFLASTVVCPDVAGVPHYSIFMWVVALPGLIFRLVAEVFAVSVYVSWYVQSINKARRKHPELKLFKVMGVSATFIVWLAVSFVFSVLNGIDQMTDTLFTAMYWKAFRCPANHNMMHIWSQVWQQSLFGKTGLPPLNLGVIIVLSWVTCQLHVLVPFATTIPALSSSVDYSRKSPGFVNSLCTGEKLSHGFVFDELAEANDSASLQSLASNGNFAAIVKEDVFQHAQIGMAMRFSETMAKRVWLSYIVENAVQVNLQATLFAIFYYVSGQQPTAAMYQSLFSIGLGIGLTFLKLLDATVFRSFSRMMEEKNQDKIDDGGGLGEGSNGGASGEDRLGKFRRNVKCIYVGFAILTASLLYATLKLFGAFFCEDSLLNLSGCVQISDDA